jgi:hypothetical protein
MSCVAYGLRITGQLTSLEVEFDVCIFLLLGTVVVRAALDSAYLSDNALMKCRRGLLTPGRCAARALPSGFDARRQHSARSACPE